MCATGCVICDPVKDERINGDTLWVIFHVAGHGRPSVFAHEHGNPALFLSEEEGYGELYLNGVLAARFENNGAAELDTRNLRRGHSHQLVCMLRQHGTDLQALHPSPSPRPGPRPLGVNQKQTNPERLCPECRSGTRTP